MAEWVAEGLSVELGKRRVVDNVSFAVRAGELTILVGSNGSGKSSLVRAALGLIPRETGRVDLCGGDPAMMTPARRASHLAYLPQARPLAWPLTVEAVVALGRFAYGMLFGGLSAADRDAVDRALTATALTAFAERRTDQLSGGELARVHIARALATEAPLLAADEPTAGLDPAHAISVMDTIRAFCKAGGGALVILHDLQLAARYADTVMVMAGGRLIASGPPLEALSSATLAKAFGLDGRIADVEGTRVLITSGINANR